MSVRYVPILKLKYGEVTALSEMNVDAKEKILPLLEVVFSSPRKDAKDKGRSEKLESIKEKFLTAKLPLFPEWLLQARGTLPYILDFNLVFIPEVQISAIKYLLEKASENKQNVIVAINTIDSDEYKQEVYKLIKQYGFGLCIRLTKPDLKSPALIASVLQKILDDAGLTQEEVHLVVDIKEEQDDQKYSDYFNIVQQIPLLKNWKNFIYGNGAFPSSMGGLKSGKAHDISRTDRVRYISALTNSPITRQPIYADYTIRHPIYDPEAEKHSPSPSIKYTTENNWHILKGADNDYGHYFVNSAALTFSDKYYGNDHCWGDKMIQEKADMAPVYLAKRAIANGLKIPAKGAGSSEDWIAIGVSHHIATTLDQLSS